MKPRDSSNLAAIGDGAARPCPSVSSSGSPPSSAAAGGKKPGTYGGKDDDMAAPAEWRAARGQARGRAAERRAARGRAAERRAVRGRAAGWQAAGGQVALNACELLDGERRDEMRAPVTW